MCIFVIHGEEIICEYHAFETSYDLAQKYNKIQITSGHQALT